MPGIVPLICSGGPLQAGTETKSSSWRGYPAPLVTPGIIVNGNSSGNSIFDSVLPVCHVGGIPKLFLERKSNGYAGGWTAPEINCSAGDRLRRVESLESQGKGRRRRQGAALTGPPVWLPPGAFKVLLQPVSLSRCRVDALHEFFGRFNFLFPLGLGSGPDHD